MTFIICIPCRRKKPVKCPHKLLDTSNKKVHVGNSTNTRPARERKSTLLWAVGGPENSSRIKFQKKVLYPCETKEFSQPSSFAQRLPSIFVLADYKPALSFVSCSAFRFLSFLSGFRILTLAFRLPFFLLCVPPPSSFFSALTSSPFCFSSLTS
jgi:hypothetical protein